MRWKVYLTQINALNGFMNFFRTEDKYNNTTNADSIEKIYSNREFGSREQLLKYVNMSEATLPDKQVVKDELRGEIEAYNNYLNGSWYSFRIEGLNGETEDCCGGFYQDKGFSDLLNYMKDYVEPQYHPLFDKLAAQSEKSAYM